MSILERESRGLPETREAWCSLWGLTVDPLEKSCYKWRKTGLNPKADVSPLLSGQRKFILPLKNVKQRAATAYSWTLRTPRPFNSRMSHS